MYTYIYLTASWAAASIQTGCAGVEAALDGLLRQARI